MIQTRDCPKCNAEHRMHIKKCGCGHVFSSQSATSASYPVAATWAAYDERIKRDMAQGRFKPAKEYQAAKPSHKWAHLIIARAEAGERMPVVALEFAKQVTEKRAAA